MKGRLALLAACVLHVGAAPLPVAAPAPTVHEWGTSTSFQGNVALSTADARGRRPLERAIAAFSTCQPEQVY